MSVKARQTVFLCASAVAIITAGCGGSGQTSVSTSDASATMKNAIATGNIATITKVAQEGADSNVQPDFGPKIKLPTTMGTPDEVLKLPQGDGRVRIDGDLKTNGTIHWMFNFGEMDPKGNLTTSEIVLAVINGQPDNRYQAGSGVWTQRGKVDVPTEYAPTNNKQLGQEALGIALKSDIKWTNEVLNTATIIGEPLVKTRFFGKKGAGISDGAFKL